MNNCDQIRELLVMHAEAVLDESRQLEVTNHLAGCSACREEAAAIVKIQTWLRDSDLFSPTDDYSWQALPDRLTNRVKSADSAKRWVPANFGPFGWAVTLAATVVVCFGLVWLTHRTTPRQAVATLAPAPAAPGNEAFLKKMQSAYAREATAQYLSDCQDLLLNVMRAEKSCVGEKYDVSVEVAQARQLLGRKRMLDAELQSPAVVHAKSLCDELEGFLVNLSTSDRCESQDKMHRMERYIHREQLLLRINVLQSELS